MDINEAIISARECGVVHCGLSTKTSTSISELAAEFGLANDTANYKEIDENSARRLVRLLLNQDLAYNITIISADRAAELADLFLAQFGTNGLKFYTNGSFHENRGTWCSWNSVTAATFDSGVLVVGPFLSGCFWVEDED